MTIENGKENVPYFLCKKPFWEGIKCHEHHNEIEEWFPSLISNWGYKTGTEWNGQPGVVWKLNDRWKSNPIIHQDYKAVKNIKYNLNCRIESWNHQLKDQSFPFHMMRFSYSYHYLCPPTNQHTQDMLLRLTSPSFPDSILVRVLSWGFLNSHVLILARFWRAWALLSAQEIFF